MLTSSDDYGSAICKAMGVDPNKVRRVVVDAMVGEPLRVYIEMFGGPELVTVKLPVSEVEIMTKEPEPQAPEPPKRAYFGQHQSEVASEQQEQR